MADACNPSPMDKPLTPEAPPKENVRATTAPVTHRKTRPNHALSNTVPCYFSNQIFKMVKFKFNFNFWSLSDLLGHFEIEDFTFEFERGTIFKNSWWCSDRTRQTRPKVVVRADGCVTFPRRAFWNNALECKARRAQPVAVAAAVALGRGRIRAIMKNV